MINILGKTLVFLTLAGALFGLTWALGIYFQKVDWGWKEPRKELDQRVASEIDKRIAANDQALRAIELVMPAVPRAQDKLLTAQKQFPQNHLFYVAELKRLREGPDPLDVKAVQYDGGVLKLDTPVIGKPVLAEQVEVAKSRDGLEVDLASVMKGIEKSSQEIAGWIAKEKDLTFKLTGRDDTDKIGKTGLYTLLEEETKALNQARFEKDYLEPLTVRAMQQAQTQRQRKQRLQATLDRILKGG
jgi:hypothetical protein